MMSLYEFWDELVQLVALSWPILKHVFKRFRVERDRSRVRCSGHRIRVANIFKTQQIIGGKYGLLHHVLTQTLSAIFTTGEWKSINRLLLIEGECQVLVGWRRRRLPDASKWGREQQTSCRWNAETTPQKAFCVIRFETQSISDDCTAWFPPWISNRSAWCQKH